jgi:hypothetical protein
MLDINLIQGNWHDLNEFFEYATEWEPSASLYFGDNVLQVILATLYSTFNKKLIFNFYLVAKPAI